MYIMKTTSKDYNKIYQVIGNNVRKARLEANLKVKDLAELCHLSEGFIYDLESETFRTISLNTMYMIADKLKIPTKQLLDGLDED